MHEFYVDWTKNIDIYNYLCIYIGLIYFRDEIYFQYIYVFCFIKVYILIYNLNILSFFVLLNVVDNIDRKINDYKLDYINKKNTLNITCSVSCFLIKYLNLLCYI
ncbi:LOW QUALITY PROTEIN: hypothetical protein PFBG_04121 [Plasmodium falciparum 7G8]|uniref:Uncharacterized protein n=1 Tax=Plasmodium falciparum (isolate 7G8) TaxID=57266 RepID=W7F954_PLAF8|nr:LOW QUALITY PROTEIN: hypothetical protein PFBG_04121 [Plasmodium falciparum 7G8]